MKASVNALFGATGGIGLIGWLWFVYSADDANTVTGKVTRVIRAALVASVLAIAVYVLISPHLTEESEAVWVATGAGCFVAFFMYQLPVIMGGFAAWSFMYLAMDYTGDQTLAALVAAGVGLVAGFLVKWVGHRALVVFVWQTVIATTLAVVNTAALRNDHSAWSPTSAHVTWVTVPWTAGVALRVLIQGYINHRRTGEYAPVASDVELV